MSQRVVNFAVMPDDWVLKIIVRVTAAIGSHSNSTLSHLFYSRHQHHPRHDASWNFPNYQLFSQWYPPTVITIIIIITIFRLQSSHEREYHISWHVGVSQTFRVDSWETQGITWCLFSCCWLWFGMIAHDDSCVSLSRVPLLQETKVENLSEITTSNISCDLFLRILSFLSDASYVRWGECLLARLFSPRISWSSRRIFPHQFLCLSLCLSLSLF